MLALVAALVVAAQPSNSWLEDARAAIARLEFAEALTQLEVARQVPGLDAATQQTVDELTAYCQVAEGRRDDAQKTFIALLERDPGAELSKEVASPKVLEVFDAARRAHFPPDYVRLTELPSPAGRAQLELIDPWKQVQRVVLVQRRDGGAWAEQPLDGGRRRAFALAVPVGSQLDWYVEARGAGEVALVSIGSAAEPRVVRVARIEQEAEVVVPPPDKTARRVAGVVALGVGVALSAVATGLEISAWNQRKAARDRTQPPGDFASTALAAERDALVQQNWAIGLFVGAGLSLGAGVVLTW